MPEEQQKYFVNHSLSGIQRIRLYHYISGVFFNDESVNAEAGRGVNKRIIDHLYITRGVQGPKLEHV